MVQAPVELEVDVLGDAAVALVALEGLLTRGWVQVGFWVAAAGKGLWPICRGERMGGSGWVLHPGLGPPNPPSRHPVGTHWALVELLAGVPPSGGPPGGHRAMGGHSGDPE